MTKKKGSNTLLLFGGGLLTVAVAALLLSKRPTGDGGGLDTLPSGGSFFDKVADFGIHNGLQFGVGYTNPFADYLSGTNPTTTNPLAPRPGGAGVGGTYGPSYSDQYSHYTNPPATSTPGSTSSGYVPAGSTTPSAPSTGGSFGIGNSGYYK